MRLHKILIIILLQTCYSNIKLTASEDPDFPLLSYSTFSKQNKGIKAIQQLLLHGANINVQDSNGTTGLMYAAFNGNREIVEFLLKNGADVNIRTFLKKDTAIGFAAQKNHKDIVELLLKAGADMESLNDSYKMASHYNNEEIKELIENWSSYQRYLKKLRTIIGTILTGSILTLLKDKITKDEFDKIKNFPYLPKEIAKLIFKYAEPTYEEWKNKYYKRTMVNKPFIQCKES